jgi:hypothetical protein
MRHQKGTVVRIGNYWFVRFYERRNINGSIQRKRVSHRLGAVTTRGKRPPAEIVDEATRHMSTTNLGQLPGDRIVTMADFVETVYLPWVEKYQRPSTLKGYRQVWRQHLKPHCGKIWLKDTRTFHVQSWLNAIAKGDLSRNSQKRIQSVVSGIFSLAKQLGYYDGVNPVQDTRIDPAAPEAAETYAYSLEEIRALLELLPEPAATAFAVCGSGKSRRWSGQIFATGSCMSRDRSGMAMSEHQKRGNRRHQCRLFGSSRNAWKCIACVREIHKRDRSSPTHWVGHSA